MKFNFQLSADEKSSPPMGLIVLKVDETIEGEFREAFRASKKQILRYVIFPNSLPEILTGIRVSVGMCLGTLVAAEFLAGTTGIGLVDNVAKKYF